MDAAATNSRHADARLERQRLAAVDAERGRLLQAGYIADRHRQHGIAPAHRLGVGNDIADVGRGEAAREIEQARVDGDIVDRAVQDLGRRLAVDLERLRQEHRALLNDLFDAFVALAGDPLDGIGDDEQRPVDVLRAAPLLRHLLADALGALLALADQPPHQEERDAEHEDQSADEEEFECGAAEQAPYGSGQAFHHSSPQRAISPGGNGKPVARTSQQIGGIPNNPADCL